MISAIEGKVILKGVRFIICMTQSNVGYGIHISARDLELIQLGQQIRLFTAHIVKEDSQELFGFLNYESMIIFNQLIKVGGVGAKTAIHILSAFDSHSLYDIILNKQEDFLAKNVSGIGKKTANRVVVELEKLQTTVSKELFGIDIDGNSIESKLPTHISNAENKTAKQTQPIVSQPTVGSNQILSQAVSALVNLGFDRDLAIKTSSQIFKNDAKISLEDLILSSLNMLNNYF